MEKYRIGIDIGGTSMKAGIVDASHSIVAKDECPTLSDLPYSTVVEHVANLIHRLCETSKVKLVSCEKIGIGYPGMIDHVTGRLVFDAMMQGCHIASDIWSRYVEYVGDAIINFVNIWRPEVVLLGGGVSKKLIY